MRLVRTLVIILAVFVPAAATAHEFWIEPEDYTVAAQAEIRANLRLGQDFAGSTFSWNDGRFARFEQAGPEGATPVEGRLGDRPAAVVPASRGGILLYRSTYDRVLYDTAADFFEFTDEVGIVGAREAHAARELPDAKFREAYFRNAKALVRVGDEWPEDRAFGLPLEIVASEPRNGRLDVQVFYDGRPLPGVLLRAWAKPLEGLGDDEMPVVSDHRTDREGRAAVELTPDRAYLLNVVHLREPSAELAADRDVVWETLWASTTFATQE